MQIPLNIIHNYIGLIVMGSLSIDLLRRNRKHPNTTTLQLGLATLCATITTFFFGIPVLFTQDTQTISAWTFVGEVTQIAAMLFMWQIVIRAAFSLKPRFKGAATASVFLIAAASIAEAVHRNFTPPYSTSVLVRADSTIAVVYTNTMAYQILNSINSLALLALGLYFLKEANLAKLQSQRFRTRGIAIGFVIASCSFIFTAALPIDKQLPFSVTVLSVAFLIIAIVGIISLRMMRLERELSDTSSTNGPANS